MTIKSVDILRNNYNRVPGARIYRKEWGYYSLDRWIREGYIPEGTTNTTVKPKNSIINRFINETLPGNISGIFIISHCFSVEYTSDYDDVVFIIRIKNHFV